MCGIKYTILNRKSGRNDTVNASGNAGGGLRGSYRTHPAAALLDVNPDADIITNDAQGAVGGNGAGVEGGIFSD